MRVLKHTAKKLILTLPYCDRLQAKQIKGYRWSKPLKSWVYPFDRSVFQCIVAVFPNVKFNPGLPDLFNALDKELSKVLRKKKPYLHAPIEQFEKYRNFLNLPFYDHQLRSFMFYKENKFSVDFSQPGAGKTAIQIALMKYHYINKGIDNILIICPKSIMEAVWDHDIKKFMFTGDCDIPIHIINNTTIKNALFMKQKRPGIYIINFEKTWRLIKSLLNISWDMIIIDESSKIKNHTAKQTKAILKLDAKYKSIMSGTPSPNNMLELFSQMKFIDARLFGESYYYFRDKYFIPTPDGFNHIIANQNCMQEIKQKSQIYAMSWKKKDCLDLPSVTVINEFCQLSKEQTKIYNDMAEEMITFLNDTHYIANIALTKIMRLAQITSGFIQNPDGDDIYVFRQNPKIDLMLDLISRIPENCKIIIWAIFRNDIELIHSHLKEKSVTYYGKNSDKEKTANYKRFKTDDSCRFFIANPKAAGMGLNLTEANYSIYYSRDYSFEAYEQSKERYNRTGQTLPMTEYHLMCQNTIDKIIFNAIMKKQKINEFITSIKRDFSQ